jgi:hypothetical protein
MYVVVLLPTAGPVLRHSGPARGRVLCVIAAPLQLLMHAIAPVRSLGRVAELS